MTVTCRCDNVAVMAIVRSGRNKNRVMHLMWSLFFYTTRRIVVLACTHIPRVEDGMVDTLSCNDVSSFQKMVPGKRSQQRCWSSCWEHLYTDNHTGQQWAGQPSSRVLPEGPGWILTSSAQKRCVLFCAEAGLQQLPAAEGVLCGIVAKLASEGLEHKTI